jgi:hypothetical protein
MKNGWLPAYHNKTANQALHKIEGLPRLIDGQPVSKKVTVDGIFCYKQAT